MLLLELLHINQKDKLLNIKLGQPQTISSFGMQLIFPEKSETE